MSRHQKRISKNIDRQEKIMEAGEGKILDIIRKKEVDKQIEFEKLLDSMHSNWEKYTWFGILVVYKKVL